MDDFVLQFLSHVNTEQGDRAWFDERNRFCCSVQTPSRALQLKTVTEPLRQNLRVRIYIKEKLVSPCPIRLDENGRVMLNPEYESD